VNRQLYNGWRLGQRKLGISSDGKGLVEAAGESIEIGGVGLRKGVGVGSGEGDGASVIDLGDEAFWEEAIRFQEGGSSNVWEGGGYALGTGVRCRVGSRSEELS